MPQSSSRRPDDDWGKVVTDTMPSLPLCSSQLRSHWNNLIRYSHIPELPKVVDGALTYDPQSDLHTVDCTNSKMYCTRTFRQNMQEVSDRLSMHLQLNIVPRPISHPTNLHFLSYLSGFPNPFQLPYPNLPPSLSNHCPLVYQHSHGGLTSNKCIRNWQHFFHLLKPLIWIWNGKYVLWWI